MNWPTLERVWRQSGMKKNLKVRFCDWSHEIKYFMIQGESSDGKRLVGTLDSGERISYPKSSKGWSPYGPGDEIQDARAV